MADREARREEFEQLFEKWTKSGATISLLDSFITGYAAGAREMRERAAQYVTIHTRNSEHEGRGRGLAAAIRALAADPPQGGKS